MKDGASKASTPPVLIYDTGEDHWDRFVSWPPACAAYDEYISDPAKPVPYVPRPVRFSDSDAWRRWLVSDQRAVADRTDVLTYVTPPLTDPLRIGGAPVVHLIASTN